MTDNERPPLRPVDPPPAEAIDERPPTVGELLASSVLVWCLPDGVAHVRAHSDVDRRDVAAWLRHIADHLDGTA